MGLLVILMKPLLNAQREAGRSEANAEFEAWKDRQRAAGGEFVDDDVLPEDQSESSEPLDSDQ